MEPEALEIINNLKAVYGKIETFVFSETPVNSITELVEWSTHYKKIRDEAYALMMDFYKKMNPLDSDSEAIKKVTPVFQTCLPPAWEIFQASLHLFHRVPEYELVHSYGGEDMGTMWYRVYKFKHPKKEIYLRVDGYYTSYDGVSFSENFESNFNQVSPVEKLITVYE